MSLSVLFDRVVEGAEAAAAVNARLGGAIAFEAVEQEGAVGQLGWVSVDGLEVGVLLVAGKLPDAVLRDAITHARWADADKSCAAHTGHARIFIPPQGVPERSGPGTGPKTGLTRDEGAALARLAAASRAAAPLLELAGAIALLDESGHALNETKQAMKRVGELSGKVPPLDLWIAVRHFRLADAAGWFLDTLGMEQLGLPDLETYAGAFGTETVAGWLRNLTLYLVQQGAPIRSGDTLDGPDEQPWEAKEDGSTVEPPRKVVRFTPCPAEEKPEEIE